MKEIVSKYPSIVARPYLLIKDDLQRKDMQRFWFENTISFLAILAGSDLIRWYKEIKYKENKTEADVELLKELQNHPSLTNVGLEHMSLGKWVMMLRETIKLLKDNNVDVVFPELLQFYNKDTEKVINQLVTIRNNDAHGNPIPEDKLKSELDKRQKLIDFLVENLKFLENYRLLMPEQIEIEGSKQLYLIREFRGNNVITSKEELNFSVRLNDVIVLNKDKNLSILPYIVYLGKVDESKNFLGIFSKYVDKDKKAAKYLNLDGSGEIDFEKDIDTYQIDFFEERKNWNEIYTNPKSNQVNLDANIKFDESSLKVNNESTFSIVLDNKKSTPLYEVKIIVEIPKTMQIVNVPKEEFISKVEITDDSLTLKIDNLEEKIYKIEDITFKVTEQGFLNLTNVNLFYKYYLTEMDEEANIFSEGEMDIIGDEIEITDPASKDKMIPIINIKKEFLDVESNPISHVKVGDDFIFEIKVKNIGFSSARDVYIDIVFPDGLSLKKGKEIIQIPTLNPMEEKNFQYVFSSQEPNFYKIDMQNVTFKDLSDKRYVTKCSDDYFIIVRSDILTEFKFKIKEFIEDLYIDEEEQKEIDATIKEIEEKLGIDAKKFYEEVEVETVINIIRDIIKKITKKKGLKFTESIYEESKSDEKITDKARRKSLVFSCEGIPFFAINLSNSQNPEFFGLKTDITKRFNEVEKDILVVNRDKFFLEHKVDYKLIRDTEKYSVPFINQWVNFILNRIEKEYLVWKELVKQISEYFDIHLKYNYGMYFGEYHPNKAIKNIYVLFDRKNKNFIVGFELNNKLKNIAKNDCYVFARTPKVTLDFDDIVLSRYISLANNTTKIPAITLKLKSVDDIEKELDKVKELYKEILYLNSYKLIDEELLNDFIQELYKCDFILEKDDSIRKENEFFIIYNIKDYKDFEAMPENGIALIENSKRGFNIFPKTYNDFSKEANELLEITKFHWANKKTIRFIKAPYSELITNEILKTAQEYEKDKMFVWPNKKDSILAYGELEYGIFLIAKNLYKDINSFEEIKKDFPNEKDFKWFISRIDKLENEYKTISPIRYEDEKFYIADTYKDTFDKLYQESPEFNYITGNALNKLRLTLFKNQIEIFKNNNLGGHDWIDKRVCSKGNYCSTVICSIDLRNYFNFAIIFNNADSELEKLLLEYNFGDSYHIRPAGRQKQHLKIEFKIDIENFEEEFDKNVEIARGVFDKYLDFVNEYICKKED